MRTKATLSDIARKLGVSRSAVAKAVLGTGGDRVRISEETRLKILETAKAMNYVPNRLAQQLRGISSKTLGVILDTQNLPVMSERLFAIEREAANSGYRLLIGQIHGDTKALTQYADDFVGRKVEALLCLFDLTPNRDQKVALLQEFSEKIVFHGSPAWPGGYCVRVDTETAIRQCIDHLIARGKRRLGLAVWNMREDLLMQLRYRVFQDVLSRPCYANIQGRVWDAEAQPGTHSPEPDTIERTIDELVYGNGVDAIIASNDVWATRLILALRRRGIRIPEDVSIVGYDNLDIGRVISPALSTIDQCHTAYAKAALQLMLTLARGESLSPDKRTITVQPELIVRESS